MSYPGPWESPSTTVAIARYLAPRLLFLPHSEPDTAHFRRARSACEYLPTTPRVDRRARSDVTPSSPWNKVAGGLTAVEGARI